jgi:DHA2 family multidrug resistance protein
MFYYSGLTLQTDYRHYALARGFQGLGYAFFFVPLSVVAYSQLKPNENNRASSLTNLFRNWGGSFGISFATTMSERRQDFHQSVMSANLTGSGTWLQDSIKSTTNYLASQGYSHADAAKAAYLRAYNQMIAQTSLLGFMDVFRAIGWVTLAVTPLLFFIQRFRVSGKPSGGH